VIIESVRSHKVTQAIGKNLASYGRWDLQCLQNRS